MNSKNPTKFLSRDMYYLIVNVNMIIK